MNTKVIIIAIISVLSLSSCKSDYHFTLEMPKTVQSNGEFTAKLITNDIPIDSVLYALNGGKSSTKNTFDISGKRLGKHVVSAIVFYNGNQNKKITNTVLHLANNKPTTYSSYEIVNEYPHDNTAFTQGLEYHNGFLYESTGLRGKSSLRKVVLETGKVVEKIDLDPSVFAEGMTIVDNKIIQLSWQKNEGYIYDLESFKFEKSFAYGKSFEGWGLTHSDTHIIKTDGTERMWFLNKDTFKEERYIETYTNKRKVDKLNELEFINGKIFANVWQKNYILIINPNDGAIDGILDLNGLQSKAGQTGEDNVLNGIAYDKQNDRLFVTGKNWNTLFEITYTIK